MAFDLLLLQANLAHFTQSPSTDGRGSHHQTKTCPEDSPISSHQSVRRAFVGVTRILRHTSRDNSERRKPNGRAELRDGIKYGTSETLGLWTERIGNDQVGDRENYL